MTKMRRLFLCTALTTLARSVGATLFTQPEWKWSYQIPRSGGIAGRRLSKNNGVAFSEEQGKVYITADDGSLHIVDPADLDNSIVFEPNTLEGTFTECRSGVAISRDRGYAVYAVQDTPAQVQVTYDGVVTPAQGTVLSSRVITVNEDGTLKWALGLAGYIAGTPVIGNDGKRIYVTQNIPVVAADGTQQYKGAVIAIRDEGDSGFVLDQLYDASRERPYGPPAIGQTPDGQDVILVAESNGDGYDEDGRVYSVVQTEPDGIEYTNYLFSDWNVPSVTKPAIGPDLNGVAIGGRASQLASWLGFETSILTSGDVAVPSWVSSLSKTDRDPNQPLVANPVLSSDGSQVFAVSAASHVVAYDMQGGQAIWSKHDSSGGEIFTSPHLSETNGADVVYVIGSLSGRLYQYDAASGNLNWEFDCSDLPDGLVGCQDAVEADFDVSSDGDMLYYGDTYGRIHALEVASFGTETPSVTPSEIPSLVPSLTPSVASESPSMIESEVPTEVMTEAPSVAEDPTAAPFVELLPTVVLTDVPTAVTEQPSQRPILTFTDTNNNAIGGRNGDDEQSVIWFIVGGVAAGIGVLLCLVVGFIVVKRRRRQKKEDDLEIERDVAFARRRRTRELELEQAIEDEEAAAAEQEKFQDEPFKVIGISPRTPDREHKKKQRIKIGSPSKSAMTNSTAPELISIQEGENEDASLASVKSSEIEDGTVVDTTKKSLEVSLLDSEDVNSPEKSADNDSLIATDAGPNESTETKQATPAIDLTVSKKESFGETASLTGASPAPSPARTLPGQLRATEEVPLIKSGVSGEQVLEDLAYLPMALQGSTQAGSAGERENVRAAATSPRHPEDWEQARGRGYTRGIAASPRQTRAASPAPPQSPYGNAPPPILANPQIPPASPALSEDRQWEVRSIDSASLYLTDDESILTEQTGFDSRLANGDEGSNLSSILRPQPSPASSTPSTPTTPHTKPGNKFWHSVKKIAASPRTTPTKSDSSRQVTPASPSQRKVSPMSSFDDGSSLDTGAGQLVPAPQPNVSSWGSLLAGLARSEKPDARLDNPDYPADETFPDDEQASVQTSATSETAPPPPPPSLPPPPLPLLDKVGTPPPPPPGPPPKRQTRVAKSQPTMDDKSEETQPLVTDEPKQEDQPPSKEQYPKPEPQAAPPRPAAPQPQKPAPTGGANNKTQKSQSPFFPFRMGKMM